MWDKGYLQQWAHNLGIGARPGHRPARQPPTASCRPSSGATNSPPKAKLEGRPLVGRRQHPARDRPGRPADQPAADGARLRGARQRRHVVTPHVGKEIDDSAGRVIKEFDPRPQRHVHDRPGLPRGDPRRPPRGGAEPRRHLLRRLRRLPDPGRRQDRHRRTPAARRPVLVRGPGAVPGPENRHRRDHGGRRLRRRIGRPGRALDPRSVFRQADRSRIRRRRTKAKKRNSKAEEAE